MGKAPGLLLFRATACDALTMHNSFGWRRRSLTELQHSSQDESVPLTPDFEQRLPHVTRDDMNRFVAEDLYYAMEEFIPGAEDDEIPPVVSLAMAIIYHSSNPTFLTFCNSTQKLTKKCTRKVRIW